MTPIAGAGDFAVFMKSRELHCASVDMATIAIGDIHGNLPALTDVLAKIRRQVSGQDTVVFLGDYIDRGPDTKGCVDAILRFQREVSAEVVCLRGNHEDWFLRTSCDYRRHSWLMGMDAFDTIISYSAEAGHTLREAMSVTGLQLYLSRTALPYARFFDAVPDDHRRFFEDLLPLHRSVDCVCTHAGLDPTVARLEDQSVNALLWGVVGFPDRYQGTETLVYGHWNNADMDPTGWPTPRIVGSTIGLDTISHGVLTAVRLPDRLVIQSERHPVSAADQ